MSNAVCNSVLRGRSMLWPLSLLFTIVLTVASSLTAATDTPIKQRDILFSDRNTTLNYIPHQLVVHLSTGAAAASLELPAEVLTIQAALDHSPVYLLNLDPSTDLADFASSLSQWPAVLWVHPNYVVSSTFPIQGSYPFPDQNLVGEIESQYAAAMLGLQAAQTVSTGSGVTVAVIDAGIKFASPALNGKAVSGFDFVDNDADAGDVPGGIASGHGTFVAGAIHLTAPAASIKSYRVINPSGVGDGFTLARAIEAAVDDGCDVINLSLALTAQHLAVRDAIDYAAANGVTVIAGAGNNASDLAVYPAAEDNALSVAAVDSAFRATAFTNFGNSVDVCAPGAQIYSAYINPDYAWWSGTSFSAAFTSGLAALLKQVHPDAYGFQVRSMILAGATNIDTLNPQRSGNLGAGLINPVASLAGVLSADTAVFFPSNMVFNYYECSMLPNILSQTGVLVSTNAPAAYTSDITPSGGVTFASISPASGLTGDSVTIIVNTSGLAPGSYRNGVTFYVEGVAEPVWLPIQLKILACSDTSGGVQVSPSEIWISAVTGSETVYYRSATLTSSNAPAPFHAQVESVPGIFTSLIDSVGVTDDSVRFEIHPNWMFSAGNYTNTINYYVDGIDTPASLTVHLNISDSTIATNTAWVYPATQTFTAPADTSVNLWGSITVGFDGESKPFVVGILDHPDFLILTDSLGMTPDSGVFWVAVTPALAPGLYVDTLIAYISGAPNSPLISVVNLFIDTTISGGDTAVVIPARQTFHAPGGVPNPNSGSFIVYASGAPKMFSVAYLDTPDFTSLNLTSGITGNGISFGINPPSSLPGVYVDTLVVSVTGVTNSPLLVVNTLIIDTASVDTNNYSAAIYPSQMTVNAVAGGADVVRQALVTSSNAPAMYGAYVYYEPETFVTIPDSIGMTNDSLTFVVHLDGLSAGFYTDTILVYVNGVDAPLKLTVDLELAAAATRPTIEMWNYPNPFNPATEIGFTIPVAAHVRLDVFNILGQRVITLVDQPMSAGEHAVNWDAGNAPSGVYYYRIVAGAYSQSKKMLLVK